MNIINNIREFLYNQNYFVSFFENFVHAFNFNNLIILTDALIELDFNKFILMIKGNNFVVKRMLKNEILVEGIIEKVEYKYHE